MPTIKSLEDQGRALAEDQKNLVLDESRPWSDKRDEYDKRDADIKSVMEQHRALKAIDGSPFSDLGDGPATEANSTAGKSIGQQFVESNQYKSSTKGYSTGQRLDVAVDTKATITEAAGGVGAVVPAYQSGVLETRFRRLTVADLMPSGTISAPSVIYMQETATTNAAATVAEGAAKPQSDITLAQVTENARKIAHYAKISDEMVHDAPFITSYINGRMVTFLQLTEEDQLLNGNGTAPNLRGILNRTGLTAVQAKGVDTAVDAIFKDITKIRNASFLDPDAIVLNPTDWQSIRLSKDNSGQYYGGGPFGWSSYGDPTTSGAGSTNGNNAGTENLWGIRVVVTPAIAQGTALVGAFGLGAQVLRRTGVTVEMTNSDQDDFIRNLITVRVEERLALAVYRPGAFSTVSGL